ncbi:MAG: DUF2341 domain-containing protein, partial [Candidatus Kerfeldbacteria bacterium]|nr:DUF2341 domain-containing protein [Candidatus Kerfeldbacteria bacterium]
ATLSAGTFKKSSNTLTIDNNFTNSGSTFTGGSGAITVSGNFTLSSGTFTSTSGTLSVAGDWNDVGGTFTHNSGTIDFTKSSGTQTLTTLGAQTYNNLTHSGAGTLALSIWSYRKQLTISSSVVSTSDQTNFPLLIYFATDANLDSGAQSDGDDIIFTSSDGLTKLSHEIEKYTTATGELVVWVKIPTLSASSNTTLYLYYGNSTASSQQDATNVWDTNFKGVWHMNNNAANTTVSDSLATNNGTAQQNTSSLTTTGAWSSTNTALTFNGSSDYIYTTDIKTLGNFAYSAWVKLDSTPTETSNIFDKEIGGSLWPSVRLAIETNSTVTFDFYKSSSTQQYVTTTDTLSTGVWYHLVGTYDGSKLRIYINGILSKEADASGTPNDINNELTIGAREYNVSPYFRNFFPGTIDEPRISSTARAASWITTEYNNQSSPATYQTLGSQAANGLTVAGNLTNSGGTLNLGSYTTTVSGNVDSTGGAITASTSTLVMNGSSKNLIGASQTLNNLTISGDTSVATSDVSVGGTLTVDATKTLTINASRALTMNAGATTTINGTISGSGTLTLTDTAGANLGTAGTLSSVVRFNSAAANVTVPSRTYGGVVEFYNNTGTNYTFTLGTASSQTLTFSSNFNPRADSTGNVSVTAATYNPTVNITGDLDYTGAGAGSEGVSMGSGTWTVSGSVDLTGGTVTAGSSTLTMNAGSGTKTLTTASQTFNNLTFNDNSGTATFRISGNLDVDGNLNLTDGILDLNTNNPAVNLAGNLSIGSGASVTKGSGAWTFDGSGSSSWTDSTSGQDLGAVTVDGTSKTISTSSNVKAASITVGANDTFNITDDTLNLTGTGTVLTVNSGGTFTTTSSTVTYSGTGATVNVTVLPYNNLSFSPSSAATYNLAGHLTGANAIPGTLTIGSNATLDATTSNYNIEIIGNWTNSGGTFTPRSGTVTFSPTTSSTISGSTTFNNFTSTSAGKTLNFGAGDTQTITGTLTLTGSSGNLLTLRSTATPTQWKINPSGTRSVSYVDVKDSNNTNATAILANNSVNSGNNTNWSFGKDFSGTVYSDDGVTPIGAGRTVAIAVNGAAAAKTATTDANGAYSMTSVEVSDGDVIIVYLDGNTEAGCTVSVITKDNYTGLNIYQSRVIVRNDYAAGAGYTTNANLATADNGDAD